MPLPGTGLLFKVSRASARLLQAVWDTVGASVTGRRAFDVANAWGGNPPLGVPTFVVTHDPPQAWAHKKDSPYIFVTDGVESAIRQARAAAGGKNVAVGGSTIVQQCLKAGFLDEIRIELVPVLLGAGIRLFDNLGEAPIHLEHTGIVEGIGVTHLQFRVLGPRETL